MTPVAREKKLPKGLGFLKATAWDAIKPRRFRESAWKRTQTWKALLDALSQEAIPFEIPFEFDWNAMPEADKRLTAGMKWKEHSLTILLRAEIARNKWKYDIISRKTENGQRRLIIAGRGDIS